MVYRGAWVILAVLCAGAAARLGFTARAFGVASAVSVASLGGIALMFAWVGVRRDRSAPFHGALGHLWFYQTLVAIVLAAFIAAVLTGGGPEIFVALAGIAVFVLLAWRLLKPPGKGAQRGGLWLTAMTLPVLVAEGTLQLASRAMNNPLLVATNPTSEERINAWRLTPGDVWMGQTINSRGYCDDEQPTRKAQDEFRILILADSFGVGYVPHEHSFPVLLEKHLNEDAPQGVRYEVVNLSVPSTGPAEYHWLLLHEGLALEPDLVVCCVFVGNDFLDTQPVTLGPFDAERYCTLRFLRRTSAAFRYRRRAEARLVDHRGPAYTPEDYLTVERTRLVTCFEPNAASLYPPTLEILEKLAALVPERLMLFIIPDEYQVDDALFDQLLDMPAAPSRHLFDRRLPNRALSQFCDEHGIPFSDPLPELRATTEQTYLLRDTHWNIAGNRIGTEVLTARIKQWCKKRTSRAKQR